MYLLDTNVISELRKVHSNKADQRVVSWFQSISVNTLFISAITLLELELGVLLKERRDPRQGSLLRKWLDSQVIIAFENRVMPINAEVALVCANLHIPNRRPDRDAMIAATSIVHSLVLVTRNVKDFAGTGVKILDPWDAETTLA